MAVADVGCPFRFNPAALYQMQAELICYGLMTFCPDIVGQDCFGGVHNSVVGTGNGIGIESVIPA